jgi:glutamine amidotransferase
MICILNVGAGNLRSVKNALDYLKIKSTISNEKKIIKSCRQLIIPGDGAFGYAMNIIKRKKLKNDIYNFITEGKPILGICLGFQILMQSSNEFSNNKGLSIFDYKVENLNFPYKTHIGFNTLVENSKNLKLLKNIKNKKFYFMHSFGVKKKNLIFKDKKVSFTSFSNTKFLSIIEYKNIFATQFHPEKSGEQGLQLLKNFSDLKY